MTALCIILAVAFVVAVVLLRWARDGRSYWIAEFRKVDIELHDARTGVDCMMNELEEIDMLLMSAQRDGADPQKTIEKIAAIRIRDERRTEETSE